MNKKQEEHIKRILDFVNKRLPEKYAKGAKEHGGNLIDMHLLQLIQEMQDEFIDLIVYLETLKEKIELIEDVNIPKIG